jgi:cytochrome P450
VSCDRCALLAFPITVRRTWNDGVPTLVAGLGIFARNTLKARQELIGNFNDYLNSGYEDAAQVIKDRIRVLSEYGAPTDDIARMNLGFAIALLSNTAPTAFWFLYNIFSRTLLLRDLRAEIEKHAVSATKNPDGENLEWEIDVVAIKTKCPLLLSVLEETQRHLTIHANIRMVIEDTKLDEYHLQKGNFVQIPNAPVHHSTDLWGSDAAEFNYHRFNKNDDTKMSSSLPSHAYLAWGTAPHLCPARQFASTEVLMMATLLVLRVDVKPVSGRWVRPETSVGELVTILPPKKDIDVEISAREGWEGKWSFKMGESKSRVPLASG